MFTEGQHRTKLSVHSASYWWFSTVLYKDTLNSCHFNPLTLMDDTLEIKDRQAFVQKLDSTQIWCPVGR